MEQGRSAKVGFDEGGFRPQRLQPYSIDYVMKDKYAVHRLGKSVEAIEARVSLVELH